MATKVDSKETEEHFESQRDYVVIKQRLHIDGIFIIKDLYKHIDEYYEEKGYDKRELINSEIVKDNGERFIEIIFEPWKRITDYARVIIKTRAVMENVKDIEIEKDGLKVKANQGSVRFVFDVYVETDYEKRWQGKGWMAVLRVIFNKYFFKNYTKQYHAEAMDDFKFLVYQIKALLNMNKI